MPELDQTVTFISDQLIWHPSILRPDGSVIGVPEFWIAESPDELSKTMNAFFNTIERHGADLRTTVTKELTKIRAEAAYLSDLLRESRSPGEAIQNGARLKHLMMLLRNLESHYRFLAPKRTGTVGD